jgi:hypothetical protein
MGLYTEGLVFGGGGRTYIRAGLYSKVYGIEQGAL